MRRKAKELQQARRDAERLGKKAPGFGGFGSSTVSGGSTAAMITETIIETDKPKVAPAPARYSRGHRSPGTAGAGCACLLWSDSRFLGKL